MSTPPTPPTLPLHDYCEYIQFTISQNNTSVGVSVIPVRQLAAKDKPELHTSLSPRVFQVHYMGLHSHPNENIFANSPRPFLNINRYPYWANETAFILGDGGVKIRVERESFPDAAARWMNDYASPAAHAAAYAASEAANNNNNMDKEGGKGEGGNEDGGDDEHGGDSASSSDTDGGGSVDDNTPPQQHLQAQQQS